MPEAFYFGCWDRVGHYLFAVNGRKSYDPPADCPWDTGLMDGGLLKNGGREDRPDGRVFWTCGGKNLEQGFWHAFYWWDRSVDTRGACNSGFYVKGFHWERNVSAPLAFKFACDSFPEIVARQRFPLSLQLSK